MDSLGIWRGQSPASGSCAATSRPSDVSLVTLGIEPGQGGDRVAQGETRVVTDGEDEFAVGTGCDADGRDTRVRDRGCA